jgi:hypothetical protein
MCINSWQHSPTSWQSMHQTQSSCSEAGFSIENGDRARVVYYRRAAFCCAFFLEKKHSMHRIFINKCFVFTVGSVCRVKRFTAGSRNSLKDDRKSRWWNRGAKVAETGVKRLSDGTSVSMLMEDMSWNKLFLQVGISHILRVISICGLYTDSPSYMNDGAI